jgi:hypothetical protein
MIIGADPWRSWAVDYGESTIDLQRQVFSLEADLGRVMQVPLKLPRPRGGRRGYPTNRNFDVIGPDGATPASKRRSVRQWGQWHARDTA